MFADGYKKILHSKVCCTCFLMDKHSNDAFKHFVSKSEQTLIREKLYMCSPELDLSIYSSITICQNCLEKIDIFKQLFYQQSIKEEINEHKLLEIAQFQALHLPDNLNIIKDEIKTEELDLSDGENNLNVSSSIFNNSYGSVINTGELIKSSHSDYDSVNKDCLTEHSHPYSKEKTVQKPFKCTECNYRCSVKFALKQHMNIHTGLNLFKCLHCSYRFTNKSGLIMHNRSIHTGEKRFKCTQCAYCCNGKSVLDIHMRIHTGEKPFKCSQCTYCCTTKSGLILHNRSIHTGEKPFKCTQCAHRCSGKSNLVAHMRTHTGEKPFKCPHCTYCSRVKSSLLVHIRIHTGEKPFKCPHCRSRFSKSHALNLHILRLHSHLLKFEPQEKIRKTY